MKLMKQNIRLDEKGFALIAAVVACLILMAIGILVIQMSTGDLRSSAGTVGEKKTLAAVDTGINRLVQSFNPDPGTWTTANNYTDCTVASPAYILWPVTAGSIDANTRFAVCRPVLSDMPPVPLAGYPPTCSMFRYETTVVGQSTSYNSSLGVDVGIGYFGCN